jgi:hypothetical protein
VSQRTLFVAYVLLFSGVVWGAQQAAPTRQTTPAQQAQTTVQPAKAKVIGTVNGASSGQPVRKASVTLMPAGNQGNQGNRGQNAFGGPGQLQPGQANTQAGAQQGQPGQAQRGGQGQNQQNNANNQNRGGGGGGGGGARSVTTGDDGTFTFSDVNPGTYRIRVDRDGFLAQEYGQRSWTGTGVPITLQPGQTMNGVSFQLVQGGTIVGRILDENLEPVTGIQVQSLTYTYQNGTRTLVSERQVQTNDLGEYRLYWLTPGDHYVSAVPGSRRGGLVQGNQGGFQGGNRGGGRGGRGNVPNAPNPADVQPEVTYASTFYPGSVDPETAAPIRVSAATEVRGIDFVLRPTPTVKVSGRVVGVEIAPTAQQLQQQAQQQAQQQGRGGRGGNNNGGRGNPQQDNGQGGRGPFGGNMQVLLTRVGTSVTGRGGGGGGRGGGGRGGGGLNGIEFLSPVNQDGTFEITNVIPGSYNLIAVQQAQNQIYSTRVRLEVGQGGVQGLNLGVRPGVELPGQIYLDGTPPTNFQMDRLRVNLNSQDDLPIGNSNAQVDATGKFTLTNVPAMSYRINLQGLPAGAYLIAGRFGTADALGEPLQVDQSSQLALQIGFAPGQVGVTVSDSVGQPFAGAITVLIPAVRNRVDLYKTVTSDQSGQVVFTGVAPGDYKVIAWEDVPQGAYLNADYVQPYEDRGQSVHVDRTSSISAQLKVIPRNQQ